MENYDDIMFCMVVWNLFCDYYSRKVSDDDDIGNSDFRFEMKLTSILIGKMVSVLNSGESNADVHLLDDILRNTAMQLFLFVEHLNGNFIIFIYGVMMLF